MSLPGILPGISAGEADQFETALKQFVDSRDLPLYKMMSYHLGWVDKNGEPETATLQDRKHGQLLMLVAASAGGHSADALPYAISVELLYNFFLIHEDVQNANTERNKRPTVWWSWGPAQAINAGDGIHAMSRVSIFEQLNQKIEEINFSNIASALETLDNATLNICEGAYLDISYQERATVSVEEIIGVARKHGSLLGVTAELGAIAAGASAQVASDLYRFGHALGTAKHLNMDVRALWPIDGNDRTEVQRGRLQSKKKSLATSHAIENGTPNSRRRLGEIFMKRVLDPADIEAVAAILEETESKKFCEERIGELFQEATQALDVAGFSQSDNDSLLKSAKIIVESD